MKRISILFLLTGALLYMQQTKGQFIFNGDSIPPKDSSHVITGDDTSHVDWTTQYIVAKGWSVMDTGRFKIADQALAMARRGAIVDAQRNLLEQIEGMRIVGETTVKDCVAQKDYIYARLDGIIKGAELYGDPLINGNTIEVQMRVPIYKDKGGVADVMQKAINVKPVKPNSNVLVGDTESVAFTVNGKEFDPAVFPQIFDEKGNLVLDFSKYYDAENGKIPKYLKLSREILDLAGYEKGTRVIDLIQNSDGTLRVNPEKLTGDKVNWEKVRNIVTKIGGIFLMLF